MCHPKESGFCLGEQCGTTDGLLCNSHISSLGTYVTNTVIHREEQMSWEHIWGEEELFWIC